MKIYAIAPDAADKLREVEAKIESLSKQFKLLKDAQMKAAHAQLTIEYHQSVGGRPVKVPQSNFTEDFNFIYTENAR